MIISMANKSNAIIRVLSALFMLAIMPACNPVQSDPAAEITSLPAQGEESSPLQTRLKLSELPLLGQIVRLSCEVESIYDAPGTLVRLELPEGVEVLDGDTQWQGDLIAGAEITFSARVRFNKEGNTTLRCRAYRPIDATNAWGSLTALFLNIGQFESKQELEPLPGQADTNTELETPGDGQLIPAGATPSPDP